MKTEILNTLYILIFLPNNVVFNTKLFGYASCAPKAVVVKGIDGELLAWIKCPSDEIAEKTLAEIYRLIKGAENGVKLEADWSFGNSVPANDAKLNKS